MPPTEHRRAGEDGTNKINEPDQTSKSTAARNGAGNTGVTAGETASIQDPDYIAQVERRPELHDAWWKARSLEAREQGCTLIRASYMQDRWKHLALLEGWKVPPANQGEPRWQMVREA
jgi:hypothetical protein